MTNRPPSPKAKTRSMSALGRISSLLRRGALIAAFALVPLIAFPAPVAAADRAFPDDANTAACDSISGWDGRELRFTVGCSNAGEGEVFLTYPDGTRHTIVAYREFWENWTGSPIVYGDAGVFPLTQTGIYTLEVRGKGWDGALQVVDVAFKKRWSLTARSAASTPTPSTPTPSTPAPSTPRPDATPKPVVTPEATTDPDDALAGTETEPSAEPSTASSVTTDDQVAVVTIDAARATVSTAVTAVGDGVQSLLTTMAAVAAGLLALGTLLVVAVVRRRR